MSTGDSKIGEVVVVADERAVAVAAADRIAEAIAASVAERGACAIALAGGTTPRRCYEQLSSRSDIDWSKLDVFFGDERCVPPDHAESNYRMAKESLLDHVPVEPRRIHRMHGEDEPQDQAAENYARELPEALDVLLLGMGPDGHTASLFPHAPSLADQRKVVSVSSPKPPPRRLTITPPVIRSAKTVIVMATGANKAERLAAVLGDTVSFEEAPVALARSGVWIVDSAAASSLSILLSQKT